MSDESGPLQSHAEALTPAGCLARTRQVIRPSQRRASALKGGNEDDGDGRALPCACWCLFSAGADDGGGHTKAACACDETQALV